MGHKHSRDEILDAALQAAVEDGLSRLTFGRLAARIEVSDRVVVYYFPSKDALVTAVLELLALRLQELLEPVLSQEVADHVALVRATWPVLSTPEVDPLAALYLEAIGLAAVGRSPYRQIAGDLLAAWVSWLSAFVPGEAQRRQAEAEAALAMMDGLLVMRHVAGPEAVARAAARLGLT